jgi:hypothetical protein
LWGIILAEGLHDWGMRAVPLFSYTLAFALQLRKSTENLSQGSRLVFRLVFASTATRTSETPVYLYQTTYMTQYPTTLSYSSLLAFSRQDSLLSTYTPVFPTREVSFHSWKQTSSSSNRLNGT